MNQPILDCRNVSYSYHNLSGETLALSNLSFQVQAGEFLSIVGPSGCGKSTLLSLIAGLSPGRRRNYNQYRRQEQDRLYASAGSSF